METFIIPIFTGIFGWFLIWLLAKSLFFPKKAIQIGGFRWESGLIPLIQKFPIEFIMPNAIDSDANFKAMQPLIEEKLDFFFSNTIKEKLPMMSMFIGEKTVVQLKTVFLAELADIFPQIIDEFTKNAKNSLTHTNAVKLTDNLAPILMKSIQPIQRIALILGICWGSLIVILLHFL